MKKPAIQTRSLQQAHRSGVAIRQNRLRTITRFGNLLKTLSNGRTGLQPSNALKLPAAFWSAAAHGECQPPGVINALEISRNLLAQKSVGEWMLAVAAQFGRPAIFHRHHHAARIGTIMRTDCPDRS